MTSHQRPAVTIFMKTNCKYCVIALELLQKAWSRALPILNTREGPRREDDPYPIIRCRGGVPAVEESPPDGWSEVDIVSINIGLDTRRAAQCQKLAGGARTVPQVGICNVALGTKCRHLYVSRLKLRDLDSTRCSSVDNTSAALQR